MVVKADGSDRWEDAEAARQAHLVEVRPVAEVQALINRLMEHQPGN
jgi:hypothetical protein